MAIPTEPIGSIPRPARLIDAGHDLAAGKITVGDHARLTDAALLPGLFSLNAGAFYIQLASEPDRPEVLRVIAEHAKPGQRIFVGVTDPIDPRIQTAEEVRDRLAG